MKPYYIPLLLWVTAVVGLVMMLLLEDGFGDNLGLVLLCIPLVVLARYALPRPGDTKH